MNLLLLKESSVTVLLNALDGIAGDAFQLSRIHKLQKTLNGPKVRGKRLCVPAFMKLRALFQITCVTNIFENYLKAQIRHFDTI